MELCRHLAAEEEPGPAAVRMAEAAVTEQLVSVWHHKSQEKKEFQPVGGLAPTGFVQGEQAAKSLARMPTGTHW